MSTDLRSGLASLPPWQRRLLAVLVVLIVGALGLSVADSRGWLDGTKDTAALRPGDCVDLPEDTISFRELAVVNCQGAHDGEVVGIVEADGLGGDTPVGACARALIDYADPERLALADVDPHQDVLVMPIPSRRTGRDASYRCIVDLRQGPAERRSLRRER